MTNKTPPIAVSRRPVARDDREKEMIAEDFDDKGLFRGGEVWTGYNTFRNTLLGLTGIHDKEPGIQFPDGAEESLGELFYRISKASSKPVQVAALIRDAVDKSYDSIMAIVGSLDGAKPLPKTLEELRLHCFLYQYQWVMFDVAEERGWTGGSGGSGKRVTPPKSLPLSVATQTAAALPEFTGLKNDSFRTTWTSLVDSATRRINGLGMPDWGEDIRTTPSIRLERLRVFVANQPSLVNLARREQIAESKYQQQREVRAVEAPKVLKNIIRLAYEKGLFRLDMIPLMTVGQDVELLRAALQVQKIPTKWKEEIRAHLPPDGELSPPTTVFDNSFFWNDPRFSSIAQRTEWTPDDVGYVAEKISKAYLAGLCTREAILALEEQLVRLVFSLFPQDSEVFRYFQDLRPEVHASWEKEQPAA